MEGLFPGPRAGREGARHVHRYMRQVLYSYLRCGAHLQPSSLRQRPESQEAKASLLSRAGQSHPAFAVCNSSALHHVFLDSGKRHELDVVVSVFLLYIRETDTQPRLLGLRLRLDGF